MCVYFLFLSLLTLEFKDTAREEREGLDLQIAQQRIQDVMRVLGNFAAEREAGKSREEYVKQLKRDLAFYYGYNKFMISQILRLFSPPEAIEFLEANETPRPVTIRCNTLKVRRRDLAQVSLWFIFSSCFYLGKKKVSDCSWCELGSSWRLDKSRTSDFRVFCSDWSNARISRRTGVMSVISISVLCSIPSFSICCKEQRLFSQSWLSEVKKDPVLFLDLCF